MTTGDRIQALRKARGWSQEELAAQIGVSRQAVSRWELDSTKPEAEKILALCDRFGVSTDYLLREDAPAPGIAGRAKQPGDWPAWAVAAFGGITLFVLKLLSSIHRTFVEPAHRVGADGHVTIVSSGYYTGFSDYVQSRGVVWLAWLAAGALALGAGKLLWNWWKRR